MAVSLNDKYVLSQDNGFRNRIRSSLVAACVAIMNEGAAIHYEQRKRTAAKILNAANPDEWSAKIAIGAATDSDVIGDATQGGTVALTVGNVSAQAALVTDAHIEVAVSSQFNSLFVPFQQG